MPNYPKYATTELSGHEALDRLVAAGQSSVTSIAAKARR